MGFVDNKKKYMCSKLPVDMLTITYNILSITGVSMKDSKKNYVHLKLPVDMLTITYNILFIKGVSVKIGVALLTIDSLG